MQTGAPFEPLRPPSPSSLGKPRAARSYRRTRKWGRRALILSVGAGALYLADNQLLASGVARSLRTFGLGLFVALDYKLNFRPEPLTGGTIEDLHRRSAERLFDLLRANGGLYLKIGQAIAMQSAVLPPEFQRMFARMFDDAPQAAWPDVEKVIRGDFGGRGAEEVFGVSFSGEEEQGGRVGLMERRARASASVAQVHWARLPDGREVAVKLQKPEIAKQVGWDLWAFRVVMRVYARWFDLPLQGVVPFVTDRLMLETDFEAEAQNSERMRALVDAEPALRGRVYVPRVYPEFTTRRVLVTEWIEGVRLWDKDATTGRWLGGRGVGSPGTGDGAGAALTFTPADLAAARRELRENPLREQLKPDREAGWRGRSGKGGLGLTSREVMGTIVDLFAAQMFKFGVVHCDPHPGNIFVRRLPSGKAQVVLLDHGLYVYMSPRFRHQYSRFWKALMAFDNATLAEVTREWGIRGAPDFFASLTLMRPYEGGEGSRGGGGGLGHRAARHLEGRTAAEAHFEAQRRMKEGLRDVLADEERWPKELVFIGRSMRVVQANNQFLGSPVNRVKRMALWASRSLYQDAGLSWRDRLGFAARHLVFRAVLLASDLAFLAAKVRQWLGWGRGMDDELEIRVRDMAREMGVELQHNVFEG